MSLLLFQALRQVYASVLIHTSKLCDLDLPPLPAHLPGLHRCRRPLPYPLRLVMNAPLLQEGLVMPAKRERKKESDARKRREPCSLDLRCFNWRARLT